MNTKLLVWWSELEKAEKSEFSSNSISTVSVEWMHQKVLSWVYKNSFLCLYLQKKNKFSPGRQLIYNQSFKLPPMIPSREMKDTNQHAILWVKCKEFVSLSQDFISLFFFFFSNWEKTDHRQLLRLHQFEKIDRSRVL